MISRNIAVIRNIEKYIYVFSGKQIQLSMSENIICVYHISVWHECRNTIFHLETFIKEYCRRGHGQNKLIMVALNLLDNGIGLETSSSSGAGPFSVYLYPDVHIEHFCSFWSAFSSTVFDKLTDSRKPSQLWGKNFHFLTCLIFDEFQ